MTETLLAWVGYWASGLIVLSMMMSSIIKFRWINLVGALLFSIYGFLLGALPVGILNGIIVLVDAYYLWQIYRKTEVFEILEIKAKSDYLRRFLAFHDERIQRYSPGFSYQPDKNTLSFFILRNMAVAGLFIAQREQETILKVQLDLVLPEYKDFKNGQYVYFQLREQFMAAGYKTVIAEGNNKNYFRYLKKLGFVEEAAGVFKKEL